MSAASLCATCRLRAHLAGAARARARTPLRRLTSTLSTLSPAAAAAAPATHPRPLSLRPRGPRAIEAPLQRSFTSSAATAQPRKRRSAGSDADAPPHAPVNAPWIEEWAGWQAIDHEAMAALDEYGQERFRMVVQTALVLMRAEQQRIEGLEDAGEKEEMLAAAGAREWLAEAEEMFVEAEGEVDEEMSGLDGDEAVLEEDMADEESAEEELFDEEDALEEQQEGVEETDAAVKVMKKRDDGTWEEVEAADQARTEEYMTSEQLNENAALLDELRAGQMSYALKAQDELAADDASSTQRDHPLTAANRFATSPSTITLPKEALADLIGTQLAHVSNRHLSEAAHKIFGGVGLPHSTSVTLTGKAQQQRPIPLTASQSRMSDMEGNVFMATLVPAMYASAMAVLVETRRRLGSAWAEGLVRKAAQGELRILDAGGAGAGVLAVRELLRAEWERMHEESASGTRGTALAEPDGKLGGAGVSPPLGSATVLTGSDALRYRASQLLDDTVFIPRLPNYLHTQEAKKTGKFDLIIASHTIWPIGEEYMRKSHVENLWSLLSTDGGVLAIIEKGVARGFEAVAAARDLLLTTRIASPGSSERADHLEEPSPADEKAAKKSLAKETGAIIAPCTNHSACPMYQRKGLVPGRRDICHFSQRYYRLPAQQHILRAKGKNFADVPFSFVAVQRGVDVRAHMGATRQDEAARNAAFAGYGATTSADDVPSLALPRAVLPPLKNRGHVILDLCTPAGTLERWTVPRSFGRQAFRDARKSSWGDLWALGAKTRVPRAAKVKMRATGRAKKGDLADESDEAGVTTGRGGEEGEGEEEDVMGVDLARRVVSLPGEGGRMRSGFKIKGVRDKRDKKADGRGRRNRAREDVDG